MKSENWIYNPFTTKVQCASIAFSADGVCFECGNAFGDHDYGYDPFAQARDHFLLGAWNRVTTEQRTGDETV